MKQHGSGFLQITANAKTRIHETDIETVYKRQQSDETFYLIDVREDSEWEKGHLPQAIHLGKGIIERDIEKRIPEYDAPIVLYCGGGFRSALAADNLQKMGYTNVESMDGGYHAWVKQYD